MGCLTIVWSYILDQLLDDSKLVLLEMWKGSNWPPPPLEKTILKKPSFIRVKYLTALCGKLESWKLLNNFQNKS